MTNTAVLRQNLWVCLLVACNNASFAGGSGSSSSSPPSVTPAAPSGTGGSTVQDSGDAANGSGTALHAAPVGTPGQLSVIVIDATNKNPIANAKLFLNATGVTATTGSSGAVAVNFTAKDTSATVEAAGYTSETQALTTTTGVVYFILSPVLKSGQARIVLSWATNPQDLDAHLFGTPTGMPAFHVWWNAATAAGVNLDTDATQGNGPETITLTTLYPGHYVYRVADYSDCSSFFNPPSNLMEAESKAYVRFIVGTGNPTEFSIASTGSGRIWTAFSFDVATDGSVKVQAEPSYSDDCSGYLAP